MRKTVVQFVFVIFLIFISCTHKKEKTTDEPARRLFDKSAVLSVDFIKQIQFAKDSVEVDSIIERFEKKLTEINFSFPPETDYNLTEEENDSLFRLFQEINRVKEEKLKSLNLIPLLADSISSE